MSLSPSRRIRRGAFQLALIVGATTGLATVSVPASAAGQPSNPTLRSWAATSDPLAAAATVTLGQLDTLGVDHPDYMVQRSALAAQVAARTGLDAFAMADAWARADVTHQRALLAGLTQVGVPYRRNASNPGSGFDCSGLTTFAWGVAGVTLTRQSGAQIKAAAPRTMETAQAGDLVWYPGHISMWLGVGKGVLHSPYPGRNVEVKVQSKNLKLGSPIG